MYKVREPTLGGPYTGWPLNEDIRQASLTLKIFSFFKAEDVEKKIQHKSL